MYTFQGESWHIDQIFWESSTPVEMSENIKKKRDEVYVNNSDPKTGEIYYIALLNLTYCKYRNFRENFIFVISVKRHICGVKNSRLGNDVPISVNDRVISPFREDSLFMKLCI